jgi:hypothetical protein
MTVVAMLAAAGSALAFHGFSSAGQVAATFSANTVTNSQSQTCTAANNDSIQVTEARFTGTAASSDANLNGPITVDAISVFDATTNAGTVSARVMIGSGAAGFEGRLVAVNVKGTLQGLVVGRENTGGQVLGNVTSTFSTTGGFSGGTFGSGTGANTAVLSTSTCSGQHSGDQDQDDDNGNQALGGSGKFGDLGKLGNTGKFGGVDFAGFGGRGHHGGGNQD